MRIPDDGLVGLTFNSAFDYIMSLPNPEDQAKALIRHSELLATPRGTALMKKIASPTTPGCKKLYDVLLAREAERESKKAAPPPRKARKSEGIIKPNLFEIFGEAPPTEETEDIDAAPPPPEKIDEETHDPTKSTHSAQRG